MTIQPRFLLALLAFACLAFATEGRLFDPASATSGDVDESFSLEDLDSNTNSNSTRSSISVSNFKDRIVSHASNTSMCDHIHPEDLPEECSCREPAPFSLVVECLKTFNSSVLNDTIGMKIDLDPCNEEGASLTLDVTEKEHNIDYTLAGITAGESKNIPIPGLAVIVPGVGNVGLDVAVLIAGNPDMLRLKIGLNACAILSTDHQLCGDSLPGFSSILPWYILKGTYSFGDVCSTLRNSNATTANATLATTVLAETAEA